MRARSRLTAALLVLASCAGLAGLAGSAGAAGGRPAPIGQDPIEPGRTYAGDFPDPSVLRIGQRYYAYSTTSDGLNVPMLTSTDLRTWTANKGTPTNPSGDALPRSAAWSAGKERPDGRFKASVWAPTVTRLGPKRFVMAYATELRDTAPGKRMCISLAYAPTPYGPFVDTTTKPTICPARGAIDPQVYVAPSGYPWLVWKIDLHPAYQFTTRMNAAGTAVYPQTRRYLARITQPWEGNIMENPAMITYRGRHYLFYSANSYASSRYAISYLVCKTWYGGCTKPRTTPLMKTGKYLAGPGGAMPFVDTRGRLRVAYHAWRTGAVGYPSTSACREAAGGCPQRRLYVATLGVTADGRLTVVRWT